MPFALPQLDVLMVALGALIVCLLVVAFAKAFFGVSGTLLGKLPVVGGWLDASAHRIEQRITTVFGGFAAKMWAVVGASWHSMARMIDKAAHELAAHAGLLATIARLIPGGQLLYQAWRELQLLRALFRRLAHGIDGVTHRIGQRLHGVEHGIGADVLPRIRTLEREVTRDFNQERARARTAEHALGREITNLWKWTRKHSLVAGTAAFATAVAAALSALGLDWIRCPTAKNVFKKRGCNMWSDLDGLLTAALAVATAMSLVELAKAEQEVVGEISDVVRGFWQV